MTILTDEFMKNELDFDVDTASSQKLYKDYYNTFCQVVFSKNAFRPTPADIEQWMEQGYFSKASYLKCGISDSKERKNWFLRAMGLQIIYDKNNGRNSMIKGSDGAFDINRESIDCLNIIGLIQPVRW